MPYLSCTKCHPLSDRYGRTLAVPFTDHRQVDTITAQHVQEWALMNPTYEDTEYWPCQGQNEKGQFVVSIMIRYKVTYLPIQSCSGVGPDVKTAKANAAQKLLESGHCMIRLD